MSIKASNKLIWKTPGITIKEQDISYAPVFRRYFRRAKMAKIFGFEYKDDLSNPNVLWSSNTAKPYKKFIVPVGNMSEPEIIKTIDDFKKKFN